MSVKNKKKLVICVIFLFIFIFFVSFIFLKYRQISIYDNKVFYNVYLGNYKLQGVKLSNIDNVIFKYSDKILSKKIKFVINNKTYTYCYRDLGLSIDTNKIKEDIISYQSDLSFIDKFIIISKKKKKVFNYNFDYDKDKIYLFVNNLKKLFDVNLENGHFVVDDNHDVKYEVGIDSFSLNVDDSYNEIINNINKKKVINLVGSSEKASNNDSYKLIDTKVSSFSTEFDPYIVRATNLKTGLSYINGAIIEPGEIFSFYKYAGPYNKEGYVFYYEYVGNGVCQIATTIYNTALLGGLEIVKRYPHDKKSTYVPGGLDATVASYSNGWNVDFQFKNTYKYPIYVSAYAIGGTAYVDFWSNSDAKEGKTYSTESVQIGFNSYRTFLHTYMNNVEINVSQIAATWYTKY